MYTTEEKATAVADYERAAGNGHHGGKKATESNQGAPWRLVALIIIAAAVTIVAFAQFARLL